jgi:hypothetical protein
LKRVVETKKIVNVSNNRFIAIINFFQNFDFVKVPTAGPRMDLGNPQKIVTIPKKFDTLIDKWIKVVEISGTGCAITYETQPKNQMKK